ncbi:hypothetical protein mRhiFer1_009346 [Rhinolophus ferrumequinum]|uniref:Uncharacterized protein n=1 Tax=Rhinolophus ferrumequinum TaxID=59479 RepID=A0A7J7RXQ7_RHIFE|nr:hypothetical protein mRhiFer1_009346 [Rhinolophus ferrumequinum]
MGRQARRWCVRERVCVLTPASEDSPYLARARSGRVDKQAGCRHSRWEIWQLWPSKKQLVRSSEKGGHCTPRHYSSESTSHSRRAAGCSLQLIHDCPSVHSESDCSPRVEDSLHLGHRQGWGCPEAAPRGHLGPTQCC